MDVHFCVDAMEEALAKYGAPEIVNTDQGSQFTSLAFSQLLKDNNIRISMDGKGSWLDNVIVERFWRTLKYEEVYLKAYTDGPDAQRQIGEFIERYNSWRPHSAHGDRVPNEVYDYDMAA